MRAFMKPKWLLSIGAVSVAAVIGVGLLFTGSEPVYAQGPGNRIPDMVGGWTLSLDAFYVYLNTKEATDVPLLAPAHDQPMEILVQTANVFAGWFGEPADKLTGVISDDGTVRLQINDGNTRVFIQGKLWSIRNELTLVGTFQSYEDLVLSSGSHMASGSFRATKAA